jgi:hypothetical protein
MSEQCHEAVLELTKGTFTIKSVKVDFGHDRSGAMGNVFFKGKKAFEFHDDGWGGEAEINYFSKDLKEKVLAWCKENNLAQTIFDNGWEFMESVDNLNEHTVVCQIAEALIYQYTAEREMKKIMRLTKSSIVFGNNQSYRSFGWKGIKDLVEFKNNPHGPAMMKKAYDDAKAQMKKGDIIFNTDEQLKALGLK